MFAARPTPVSPLTPTNPENPSLSTELNACTRHSHALLNALLTARLPLALPPLTHTPELYTLGIAHFASIYAAFESSWTALVTHPSPSPRNPDHHMAFAALKEIYLPNLLRTRSLDDDLTALWSASDRQDRIHRSRLLDDLTGGGHDEELRKWVRHIESVSDEKPHVLMAYPWVLYSALFNGGRWIRAQLVRARDESWDLPLPLSSLQDPTTATPITQGLSFWSFSEGSDDGEGLKGEFKRRLERAGEMLSEEMRREVLEEARGIFERCMALVGEVDGVVASCRDEVERRKREREMERRERMVGRRGWDGKTRVLRSVLPMGLAELLGAVLQCCKALWKGSLPVWKGDGNDGVMLGNKED